ncbi:MAG: TonB-dependent receptor, partial [Sedimenticolaceae bacterium]
MGAATDSDGSYFSLNVPPARHIRRVSYIGYIEAEGAVSVITDLTTTRDFLLSTTVIIGREVVVTGERAPIQMDRTNTASFVTAEQIEDLPVQDIGDLIQLQAGVVIDQAGGVHIRGGRTSEVAYWVDGVPVSDQFSTDGGSLFNVETGNIQELQVISGTFNAEYGQAQSGVINVITKDPGQAYSWQFTTYAGGRLSNNTDIFSGIDQLRLSNIRNLEGRIAGPLPILPKAGFYVYGRYISDDGYLFGKQLTKPEDAWRIAAYETWYRRKFAADPSVQSDIIPIPDSLFSGDGSVRAMNPEDRLSLNVKIVLRPLPSLRTTYSVFIEDKAGRIYDDDYRYTPDALKHVLQNNQTHILNVSHTLSSRSFYLANISYTNSRVDSFLFEELVSQDLQTVSPVRGRFNLGGTKSGVDRVESDRWMGKLDWSWQIDNYNLIKFGAEGIAHRVFLQSRSPEITSDPNFSTNYFPSDTSLTFAEFLAGSRPARLVQPQLTLTDETGLSDVGYEHRPLELAAYIQDTIELNELILNFGLRYEWFKPDHKLLVDPRVLPAEGSVTLTSSTDLKDATPKFQLSPRLGLAFPISDAGVLHVAYGHFFKLPPFAHIYDNSEYKIVGLNSTIVGNPDLKPQKTISYELGLQQELIPGLGLETTLFYSDFRNLLGLEVIRMVGNVNTYSRRTNRDYGFNKGIMVAVRKTRGTVTGTLDYTYQVGMGNESDPDNIAVISTGGAGGGVVRDAEKQVLPLDWDQRHTLNGTLAISTPNAWTFSFVGRVASGQPYTPEPVRLDVKTKFRNTEFKPWKSNLDFYANKEFHIGALGASF